MSCRSRIAAPRGVVIVCSTGDEAQHAGASRSSSSRPRCARCASLHRRRAAASRNSSSPPAHIRRGSGTGGRKPPRVGWPSGPSCDIGNTGCARHQCVVHGAASPGLRLADLLEQRRAQTLHQLRGDDVGGLRGAADPLPQMVEVELFGGFGHDDLVRRGSFGQFGVLADRRAPRRNGAARRRRSRRARRSSPCRSAYRPRCGADADARRDRPWC